MSAFRAGPRRGGAGALGQLLFIELEDPRWTSACERLVRLYQPGGVLLSQRNLRAPGATAQMLAKIACALDFPPFLALEAEGGTVDPLGAFFPRLPAPRAAAKRGLGAVRRLGELIGEALSILGFSTNFAPRLDLASPLVTPALDQQKFGFNPQAVAQCGRNFVAGLRRHGILSCGKHFPGLGAAGASEHGSSIPVVDKPMAELWRADLVAFRKLLSQLSMVSVSHAAYKAYDLDVLLPAALSSNILRGLLRVKLGFRGVAVADFFKAAGGWNKAVGEIAAGQPESAVSVDIDAFVKSINAGIDMLVVGWKRRHIEHISGTLKKALEAGTLPVRRVEEALKRIRLAKEKMHFPTGQISKRAFDRLVRDFETFGQSFRVEEQKIA